MSRLYAALRGLMAANDYTQHQFARAINVAPRTMDTRMQGKYPFTLDEAYATLDLFRIPHDRLHEIFPKDGRKAL
ncbi:MAG: helix-turn-helix transcriptional regulator [Candidatus Limiplasma sp.]|nr:helix-turn-helix transcriptional regulator [Candidatus Limiplasma sp.]